MTYVEVNGRESHSILGDRTPLWEVPVVVAVCRRSTVSAAVPGPAALYGSIFPAIQNLALAARALGIGSTISTLHLHREREFKAVLGVPDEVEVCALALLGYPRSRFGPLARRSRQSVTYSGEWGRPYPVAGSSQTGTAPG